VTESLLETTQLRFELFLQWLLGRQITYCFAFASSTWDGSLSCTRSRSREYARPARAASCVGITPIYRSCHCSYAKQSQLLCATEISKPSKTQALFHQEPTDLLDCSNRSSPPIFTMTMRVRRCTLLRRSSSLKPSRSSQRS